MTAVYLTYLLNEADIPLQQTTLDDRLVIRRERTFEEGKPESRGRLSLIIDATARVSWRGDNFRHHVRHELDGDVGYELQSIIEAIAESREDCVARGEAGPDDLTISAKVQCITVRRRVRTKGDRYLIEIDSEYGPLQLELRRSDGYSLFAQALL